MKSFYYYSLISLRLSLSYFATDCQSVSQSVRLGNEPQTLTVDRQL